MEKFTNDEIKIKIEIDLTQNYSYKDHPTSSRKKVKSSSGDEEVEFDLSSLIHPISSLKKKYLKDSVIANRSFDAVQQNLSTAVSISLNRYFNMSENYQLQNALNNVKTAYSKAKGLASSVVSGAMAGGVVGAGIGLASWGLNEAIQYQARMGQYYSSLNEMNMNLNYSTTRIGGLVDNNRGTEN